MNTAQYAPQQHTPQQHTPNGPRPVWQMRFAVLLTSLAALVSLTGGVVGTAAANASVYSSCTIAGCADAREADDIWASKGYPTTRTWYSWPDGRYNFAGGRFYNREGQLPSGATYYEYDVYPRAKGASRDAYRIVVNRSTGVTWYSPNHYTDFYRL